MVNAFTPYPDVNRILKVLLADIQVILGKQFIGMYLHGSLAYGDFNSLTSDIDFLVVTGGQISAKIFCSLKVMHTCLYSSGLAWSRKLEGAYIPIDDLRRHDAAHGSIPWLGEDGHFALELLGSDWILQRWILREHGIIISGPALIDLIDPVSAEALQEAVRGILRDWWSPPFASPQRFQSSRYQVYSVLTMCRSLYVLEYGRMVSKPDAARWAMKTLAEPWRSLISAAAAWQPGNGFNKMNETMKFIAYTLSETSRQIKLHPSLPFQA